MRAPLSIRWPACLVALGLALLSAGCGDQPAAQRPAALPYALEAPAGWQVRTVQRTDAGTQQVLQQADGTGSIAIRWRRGRPQGQLAEGLKAELASRVGTPVAVTARDKVRLAGVAADVVTLTAGAAGGENGGALLWTRGALAVRPGRDFAMIVATVALPEDRSDTFGAMDAVLRSWGWT